MSEFGNKNSFAKNSDRSEESSPPQAKKCLGFLKRFGEFAKGIYETYHSVHPPPFLLGGLNLLPNFQKEGLDRTSTLRGGNFERRGRGGCNFAKNEKLKSEKSEIFNDKKSL